MESRMGVFREYSKEGIFLRQAKEVKTVPKYSWIKNRHLLERFMPFPMELLEVYNSDNYECVYVFEKGDQPLPVKWEPLRLMLDLVMYGPPAKKEQETEQEKDEKELKMLMDYLGVGEEELLAYGGGVTVPSNYESQKDESQKDKE